MSVFPETFAVSNSGSLVKMNPTLEYDGDPRGIVWCFEPPQSGHTYVMGIDVAVGKTGWNRYARYAEDGKIDNGAIEIIRMGRFGKPDVQVAEYAAPVDPFELGDVANLLGRIYHGTEEDQCKCIIEVHPGPGFGTLQRMMESGYMNHFRWESYADSPASQTKNISFGWHASNRTNRDLWVKSSRHITLRNAIIKSPFLVDEYAGCQMNLDKQYGENPGGHDDRVRAFNLAVWCANGWSMAVERTTEYVRQNAEEVNWAATDMSMDEIHAQWDNVLDSWDRG